MWNDRMIGCCCSDISRLNIFSDLSSATVRGARGAGGSRLRLRRATGTAASADTPVTLVALHCTLYGKMSREDVTELDRVQDSRFRDFTKFHRHPTWCEVLGEVPMFHTSQHELSKLETDPLSTLTLQAQIFSLGGSLDNIISTCK